MFNKNRACQHLRLQGVKPTESSRFTALVKKWHDRSGPEWTVNRLKSLEHYAKEKYLGKNPDIPIGWAVSSSRAYTKRFKDDLLHELFSSAEFELERALQFCRLASAISLRKWKSIGRGKKKSRTIVQLPPSKAQLEKTLTAIEGPADSKMNHDEIYSSVLTNLCTSSRGTQGRGIEKYPCVDLKGLVPMVFWPVVDTTAPYFDKFGQVQTAQRNLEQRTWSLEILYNDSQFSDFLGENLEFVTNCIFGDVNYTLPPPSPGNAIFALPTGAFSMIQEQGCKLRPVSSPFLAIQAINEPLKHQLTRISKTIPEIVTYNQQAGRDQLQIWLESETKVWSIDASSFTDRFPLKFQMEVLNKLLSRNKITQAMFDAFLVTTKHPYYSKELGRNIAYDAGGQPQGLGPSFVLATLAHYELLESLRKGLDIKSRPFRLVGDDVIISDERLAHSYMLWMDACNVEINMSKTIISNSLGEFAGAQITQDEVIMRPKLGHLKSNDTVVSLFDIFTMANKEGKFLAQMNREFGKLSRKMHLPEDFGGRRHMLYKHNMSTAPLDDFNVVKARLVKEVKELIPYTQHDIIKFFEKKRWLTTGILHSSAAYIDNPSTIESEKDFIDRVTPKPTSALELGLIADLRDTAKRFLEQVKASKDLKSLRILVNQFQQLINRHGYLLNKQESSSLAAKDFQHQVSKLVGVESEQLKALDEATRTRKSKSIPTNSGWNRFLK